MNRKGFTLTELLAVIAIIGIISLIAVPNIVNITDNVKRDNMLDDAKRFISLAKLEVNSNYEIRSKQEEVFSIISLNKSGDFTMEIDNDDKKIVDVDGGFYDNGSYVKYFQEDNTVKYCIYLKGSKRSIGSANSCVNEELLASKEIVHVN